MNITSASATGGLWQLLQSAQTSTATVNNSAISGTSASSVSVSSGDKSSVSGPAQLFAALQTLSSSNPAEFKKIAAQIATQLQEAAKNSTDPSQSEALSQLASNFQTASQSGQFSDLFGQSQSAANGSAATQGVAHGGHHHHYHGGDGDGDGGSTSTSAQSQSSSNPLSAIFSNALTQIQTDLSSSASDTSAA